MKNGDITPVCYSMVDRDPVKLEHYDILMHSSAIHSVDHGWIRKNDTITVIIGTPYHGMPDVETMKRIEQTVLEQRKWEAAEDEKTGKIRKKSSIPGLKSQDYLPEYLSANTDLHIINIQGKKHYMVGEIAKGIKSVTRANVVRTLVPLTGDEDLFHEVLEMMANVFVHNGRLTTQPYPFKYAREIWNSEYTHA